jgi:hypothetical protein
MELQIAVHADGSRLASLALPGADPTSSMIWFFKRQKPEQGLQSGRLTPLCRQADAWRGQSLAVGDIHRHLETVTHFGEFRLGPHDLLQHKS